MNYDIGQSNGIPSSEGQERLGTGVRIEAIDLHEAKCVAEGRNVRSFFSSDKVVSCTNRNQFQSYRLCCWNGFRVRKELANIVFVVTS